MHGSDNFFIKCADASNFLALTAGYEQGNFRYSRLAEVLFNALPSFALKHSERASLNETNTVERMRRAAQAVYTSDLYQRRGEFGELLLHLLMVDYYGTVPAVSKIYYKDGSNETVKGFDAVHVVGGDDGLELWLGECKFYENISTAISHVVTELNVHTGIDYLRGEFIFVGNKVDERWEHAEDLLQLLSADTSIDKIFSRIVVPVLLTYDSPAVRSHRQTTDQFLADIYEEVNRHANNFWGKPLPANVRIVLILFPLEEKQVLQRVLNEKLSAWQRI